jgi:hypothetical protein
VAAETARAEEAELVAKIARAAKVARCVRGTSSPRGSDLAGTVRMRALPHSSLPAPFTHISSSAQSEEDRGAGGGGAEQGGGRAAQGVPWRGVHGPG